MALSAARCPLTKHVPVVGIVGGIASGKTEVARFLEGLGAGRLDADRAGHEVLREPEVISALRARWGDGILAPQGGVDRGKVGAIVFRDPAELRFLESWSHPRIGMRLREEAAELEAAGKPLLILDAAVLLKAGWDKFCNAILFVDAPREVRLARAAVRGWDAAEFAAREASQENTEQKRLAATHTIDNSGDWSATERQLRALWPLLAARRIKN